MDGIEIQAKKFAEEKHFHSEAIAEKSDDVGAKYKALQVLVVVVVVLLQCSACDMICLKALAHCTASNSRQTFVPDAGPDRCTSHCARPITAQQTADVGDAGRSGMDTREGADCCCNKFRYELG